ncbi:helix-turn-helix domain-containing protein [Nannocystis pusilla]|uniref:helix-turn-helix domain-containing protein n=1 Tax=Nannocystis pusilla TaxID=889268 RepID=UPI003B82821D
MAAPRDHPDRRSGLHPGDPGHGDGDPELRPRAAAPPRLAKIARLVISGCTDKQIATRTGLSFSTVRTYVRQIYRRIGVHSRVELVHATNPHSMTRGLD